MFCRARFKTAGLLSVSFTTTKGCYSMKTQFLIFATVLVLAVGGCAPQVDVEAEQMKAQAQVEEQNKALMLRWIEEINKRKSVDVIDDFLSPDYVWHLAGEDVSFDGVKRTFDSVFSNYPDLNLTAEEVIVAGDKVIVRWTVRGTHKETGEKSLSANITIDRVMGDKFVEGWELLVEGKGWMDRR